MNRRLTDQEASRTHAEYLAVEGTKSNPPIYGYLLTAVAVTTLIMSRQANLGPSVAYVVTAILVVANNLVAASFSYSSLQIQDLKLFQTEHSGRHSAQVQWEFYRRSTESVTSRVRRSYWGAIALAMIGVSIILSSIMFRCAVSTVVKLSSVIPLTSFAVPLRCLYIEFFIVPQRWIALLARKTTEP